MKKSCCKVQIVKNLWRKLSILTLGVVSICFLCLGVTTLTKASAETLNQSISLTDELAKINAFEDIGTTNLKIYGCNDWAGYGRRDLSDAQFKGEFHNTYINDVKIGDNSDFPLTALRKTGRHNVGNLTELQRCRIFSVEYTALNDGYLTISGGNLSVVAVGDIWNPNVSYNGKLAISVTKNDVDNIISPAVAGWEYYLAGNTYTLEDKVIEVKKGDKVYLNMRAERLDEAVAACYVVFDYSPVFTYSKDNPNPVVPDPTPIDYDNVVLSEDLARITTFEDLTKTALKYYTANSWAGYNKIVMSEEQRNEHPHTYLNDVQIHSGANLELVNLRATGTHTIGVWNEANVNRVIAIGYQVKKNGTVTIPSAQLNVLSGQKDGKDYSSNGSLGMKVTLNGDSANPSDADWKYYEIGTNTEVKEQKFNVNAGDVLYINFYPRHISTEETSLSYLTFEYNPSFIWSETVVEIPENIHSFSHKDKLTRNENGELINDMRITESDETTYPFSYLYRTMGGSHSGHTGTELSTSVMEMSPNPSLGAKNIYAGESFSGFIASDGAIVTVANLPDPNTVILAFTSPYDGKLTISNISLNYTYYPNNKNNYEFYGNSLGAPFEGYGFRVMLNDKQVWPTDSAWDKSMAKLYDEDKDGYKKGDLIANQKTNDISDIYVRKNDVVYMEFTRANLAPDTVQNCDGIKFNPTFTVDTNADMTNYVNYVSSIGYFDVVNNENLEENLLSYWYYDTTAGIYDLATEHIMPDVDFAANAYSSGLLDDNAGKIGWNYFMPVKNRDVSLKYLVKEQGNLTISAESLFRNGTMALWQYYDYVTNGNIPEADGIRMRIEINGVRAWPTDSPWKEYKPDEANKGVFNFEPLTFGVNKGDKVAIRINCGTPDDCDGLNFDPIFALKASSEIVENPAITVEDPKDEQKPTPTPDESSVVDSSSQGQSTGTVEAESGCSCSSVVQSGGSLAIFLSICALSVFLLRRKR